MREGSDYGPTTSSELEGSLRARALALFLRSLRQSSANKVRGGGPAVDELIPSVRFTPSFRAFGLLLSASSSWFTAGSVHPLTAWTAAGGWPAGQLGARGRLAGGGSELLLALVVAS